MTKTPGEYARWVRKVHTVPDDTPVDLDRLVTLCGGCVQELDLTGCSGALLPVEGRFGIAVRRSEPRVRKRFTTAHELGHFCIPSHKKKAARCVAPELSSDGTGRNVEREANEFAAELLMPHRLVDPMVSTGAIDLTKARDVMQSFDVSRLSAALRVCKVTRERAAVVYFQDEQIKWAFRCGLPYGLPTPGSAAPGGSIAWDIISGKGGSLTAREVDAGSWMPFASPDPSWGPLMESSERSEESNDIVTILWLPYP